MIVCVFKTWWLHNIHFFFDYTIKKCTFDIHLIWQNTIVICKGKHDTNGFKTSYWSIGFTEINTSDSSVTLCNQSCFVSYHNTIFILLVAKDPLRTNDIMLHGIGSLNKGPNFVYFELMKFFDHGK